MLKFDGKNIETLAKYLNHLDILKAIQHAFTWKVLMAAPINDRVRENLEGSFIALSRPSLNERIDPKKLLLFRNCVT